MNRFIAFFILLCAPFLAFAHATPLSYNPAPGAVLLAVPQSVSIAFNERLEMGASSIRVFDPRGEKADSGILRSGDDLRTTVIDIAPSAEGTYSVAWQVLSADDGHITKGAYSFSVGTTTLAVGAPHYDQKRSPLEGFAVGLELLGSALLLGFLVARYVVRADFTVLPDSFFMRAGRLVAFGVSFIAFGGLLFFVSKSFELGSGLSALKIFAGTAPGRGTLERIVHALLFGVVVVCGSNKLRRGLSWVDAMLLSLLLASTLVRTQISHAAASLFMPGLSVAINFVHLFWKEVWIGGVLAFVYLVVPLAASHEELFKRFRKELSRVALYAFLFGGISGTYVVWLHLKGFGNIFTTLWGQEFVLMSVLAFFLVLFRVCGELFGKRCVWFLKREALTGAVLALVTGFIIITTPPLDAMGILHKTVKDQGIRFDLRETSRGGDYDLFVSGAGFEKENLVVQAFEKKKDIGPLRVALRQLTETSFALSRSELAPPGEWTVSITLLQPEAYDAHATFVLDTEAPNPDESPRRHFGLFDAAMLATVFAVTAAFFAARRFLR